MKNKLSFKSLSLAVLSLTSLSTSVLAGNSTYIEPPMVNIPAGDFMMGSELGREDEKPVHKVSLKAFQMGKYEVTIAEFRKFIEATGYKMSGQCGHRIGERWFGSGEKDGSWDNNIYATNEFYPVVCISRPDAVNYANWLSQETGKNYRLPTEAEWEYTVRAGTTTRYFYGDEIDSSQACQYANLSDLHAKNQTKKLHNATYNDGYTIQPCTDNEVLLSVVGLYEPNPFGVYNLLGNVVERLADCYQDSYQGAPTDGSAVTKKDCKDYVVRGSSWHWQAFSSSKRGQLPDDFLAALEGFRLVLDTDGKTISDQPGTRSFVKKLTQAQAKARALHAGNPSYPSKPQGLRIEKDASNKLTLSWNKSPEKFVSGYEVYRQDPITNNNQLISTNLKTNHFVDTAPIAHNARYSVVAINDQVTSLTSDNVDSGFIVAQNLPAKIQGESFYHSVNTVVRNSGMEPDNDKIIASLGNGSVSYQLNVSQTGKYQFNARVFDSGSKQNFEIWLNGRKLISPTLEGKRGWITLNALETELSSGSHTLTIKGQQAMFAVNWLDIKSI